MELVLHLGAHRTGSTALQRSFEINRAALAADAISYWGPEDLRPRPYGFLSWGEAFDDAARAACAADIAAEAAGDTRTLVMAEENIIGSMRRNLGRQKFYADAGARLAAYRALLDREPVRIGLGIRDYASYWSSVYAFLAPHYPFPPFETIKPALVGQTRGWRDLIDDLRAAFPRADILVWALEAVSDDMLSVAARLAGRTPAGMVPVTARVNESLGVAAIPHILAARAAGESVKRGQIRAKVAAEGVGDDAAALFSLDEALAMTGRYSDDFAALEAGYRDVTFIGTPEAV